MRDDFPEYLPYKEITLAFKITVVIAIIPALYWLIKGNYSPQDKLVWTVVSVAVNLALNIWAGAYLTTMLMGG
jgi:hypothetical protein